MKYCLHYIPRPEMYDSKDSKETGFKYEQLGFSPRQDLITTPRTILYHILWFMVGGTSSRCSDVLVLRQNGNVFLILSKYV
jgi:hypothetical protein